MASILIIFTLIMSSFANASDDFGSEVNDLNRQRKAEYERAYDEIKDLNYLRMKILGIDSVVNRLNSGWSKAEPSCKAGGYLSDLENCQSQIRLLIQEARMNHSQLQVLIQSKHYEELLRSNANKNIGIERLVHKANKALIDFITRFSAILRSLSERIVKAQFETAVKGNQGAEDEARVRTRCAIMPSILSQKLNAAKISKISGMQDSDPYLVVRSQMMAEDVVSSVAALKSQCPSTPFNQIENQAKEFIAQQPSMAVIRDLAIKSCPIAVKVFYELERICATRSFNPSVYYSIHQAIHVSKRTR